jgi:hypothetical protein
MGNSNVQVWVESLWLTHKESVSILDAHGNPSITKDIQVGLTVKSDGSASADDMYKTARREVTRMLDEEKRLFREKVEAAAITDNSLKKVEA